MTKNLYVDIHVLQTVPASNINAMIRGLLRRLFMAELCEQEYRRRVGNMQCEKLLKKMAMVRNGY